MGVGVAGSPAPEPQPAVSATALLDIVERLLHENRSEWVFLRELRAGTGRRNTTHQRLDAFALNCLPYQGMKRICYEVKISRADFLTELRHPLKRRVGMRYSNEFYFVAPGGMLQVAEIPVDCGLIEAGTATPGDWQALVKRAAGFFHFDAATRAYCLIAVPAPWRDTPGPSWQFTAAMLLNHRRELEGRPPARAEQGRLELE